MATTVASSYGFGSSVYVRVPICVVAISAGFVSKPTSPLVEGWLLCLCSRVEFVCWGSLSKNVSAVLCCAALCRAVRGDLSNFLSALEY